MIQRQSKAGSGKSGEYWLLRDQIIGGVGAFITTVITARALTIEAFGWFSAIMLCQLFLLVVQNAFDTGPYQVLVVDCPDSHRKKYKDAVFGIQSVFLLALIFLFSVLYIWMPATLERFQQVWWWIVISICGFLLQDHIRRFFIADADFFHSFWVGAITSLIQLVALLICSFQNTLDFFLCFKITAISYLPSIILGIYWLKLERIEKKLLMNALRQHLLHGRWLMITAQLQWWAGNFFIVAAGLLLGASAFGALRLAQSVFAVLDVALQVFENNLIPYASRIQKISSAKLEKFLLTISFKTALIILPLLLVLALFARPLLIILGGEQYQTYSILIPGLAILQLLVFLSHPIRIAIRVLLLNKVFFTGYVITTIFSFLAARAFIHWGEIEGVIAGLIINQLLIITYWQVVLQRRKFVLWR